MTEQINHAEEARNFLRTTTFDAYGDDDRKVAIANVHATLALAAATERVAEQARIGNLIALGQYTIVPGNMPQHRGVIYQPADHEDLEIRTDIREGLGL